MIYTVDIVAVPAQAIVSLGEPGPLSDIGARMRRLRELVTGAGLEAAGPMMARFYGDDMHSPVLDYDVCLPVRPDAGGSVPSGIAEARGLWLPLHHVLQAEHRGRRDQMDDAWRAVREACEALGYRPSGPMTEVYVSGSGGDSDAVTYVRLSYAR